MTREQILQSALQLSEEDRLRLVTDLLETVPTGAGSDLQDFDEEFLAEIRRRGEEGTRPIPWETVREQGRLRRT